jgi:hypothetical protein
VPEAFTYGSAPQETIVEPFVVRYQGRDADRHVLDAIALGRSLDGAGHVYSAVAHFCFFGDVPGRRYARRFACYAQSSRPGSLDQFLYIAPIYGHYQLHAQIYNKAFSWLFGHVTDAVKKIWTKPNEATKMLEELTALMKTQSGDHKEVVQQFIAALSRSNTQLVDLHSQLLNKLPDLADATRPAAKNFVEPVGKSCRSITAFPDSPLEYQLGEAEAQAIKAGPASEVQDMATYNIERISGINVDTGSCQVDLAGGVGRVRGRITDPALTIPGNPYTEALNNQNRLTVEAKAVLRNGELHSLFISNTKVPTE